MPPSGFAVFFLRSIAPRDVATRELYRGTLPFILIQMLVVGLLWRFPGLATVLPAMLE
jgi:TRAP-type mannitol/chloroaromatic compound transport system permease large subunit